MTFFYLVNWALIVNIQDRNLKTKSVIGNIEKQIFIAFGALDDGKLENFIASKIFV